MSINLLRLVQVNTHPCLDTKPAHDLCSVLARGLSLEVIKCMVILEHVGPCLHTVHSEGIVTEPLHSSEIHAWNWSKGSLTAGSESSYQDRMWCPGILSGKKSCGGSQRQEVARPFWRVILSQWRWSLCTRVKRQEDKDRDVGRSWGITDAKALNRKSLQPTRIQRHIQGVFLGRLLWKQNGRSQSTSTRW